jgi:pimeloyl-ACP methyl ester carboxylesterase
VGIRPAEIRAPIHWWHGNEDAVSPLSHAQHVLERLPGAGLTVIDEGGHFMIHEEIDGILTSLAPHTLVG